MAEKEDPPGAEEEGEGKMKLLKPVIATAATEAAVAAGLWKLGTFPVFYLMITAWKLGFWALAGGFLVLTWGLLVLWLPVFNRR